MRLLTPSFLLLLLVALPTTLAGQVANTIPAPADSLNALIAAGTAFASVAVLGAVKKYTGAADTWIGQKIKPVQPWLVTVLSLAMPAVIHGTPNVPDAATLVAAPTATLLAVGLAEIVRRFVPAAPTSSARRVGVTVR